MMQYSLARYGRLHPSTRHFFSDREGVVLTLASSDMVAPREMRDLHRRPTQSKRREGGGCRPLPPIAAAHCCRPLPPPPVGGVEPACDNRAHMGSWAVKGLVVALVALVALPGALAGCESDDCHPRWERPPEDRDRIPAIACL